MIVEEIGLGLLHQIFARPYPERLLPADSTIDWKPSTIHAPVD